MAIPKNQVKEDVTDTEESKKNGAHSHTLLPGDANPELVLQDIKGQVLFSCQLSPRMAFLTMKLCPQSQEQLLSYRHDTMEFPRHYEILDVILKPKDGWTIDQIALLHKELSHKQEACHENDDSQRPQIQIQVCLTGYLERMRRKFETDSAPLVFHPTVMEVVTHHYNRRQNTVNIYQAAVPPTPTISDEKATNDGNVKRDDDDNVPDKISDNDNHHVNNNTKSKSSYRGANDNSRFAKLVQFLLAEFGSYETLAKLPVLDVAGGAGGLAFELSVRHAIPTIVIDTTTQKWKKPQLNCLQFRQHCLAQLDQLLQASTSACHKSPLVTSLRNRFQSVDILQIHTLLDTSWVLSSDNTCQKLTESQQQLYDILHTRQCSVLVGLHPDQATDAIVAIGLALNIAWVVVPCCVFPNLFVTRRLQDDDDDDGRVVRNYDDLCLWLKQQHPNVQETQLPFKGRNRVFYWHPEQE